MKSITLVGAFDAHMHWRQTPGLLEDVYKYSTKQFAGGLLMPNTSPNITSWEKLYWYISQITNVLGKSDFLVLLTYYLSGSLSPKDFRHALKLTEHGWPNIRFGGVKYYPKGATTGSDAGLTGFKGITRILESMERTGVPLLIHGEAPLYKGKVVDDFERERVFLETEGLELVNSFSGLKIVLEHITTAHAVNFALSYKNVVATITPQHCLFDRRSLFNHSVVKGRKVILDHSRNGMNASYMCRPVLKGESDLKAIQGALKRQAADPNLRKFGLGTDTAPHTDVNKYRESCACGVFSSPIALEMYAMAFEQIGILDHLQTFACDVMPEFYGIKSHLPHKEVVLVPKEQLVQQNYDGITPPFAGQKIPWKISEID